MANFQTKSVWNITKPNITSNMKINMYTKSKYEVEKNKRWKFSVDCRLPAEILELGLWEATGNGKDSDKISVTDDQLNIAPPPLTTIASQNLHNCYTNSEWN